MEQPPPTTYAVSGAAIRTRRKDLGLSIAALASQAGMSKSHLTNVELGRRRHLRPRTYQALRTAMGLPPDDTQLLAPPEDLPNRSTDAGA